MICKLAKLVKLERTLPSGAFPRDGLAASDGKRFRTDNRQTLRRPMHRASSSRSVVTASQKVFLAILFLSLVLAGCGNECLLIVSNPGGSGGIVAGGVNSCPVGPTTGNVRLRLASSFASTSGDAAPARIQHIFVTLRGIEANPSANADEGSPDWQELAPKLATHLAQVDLLAPGGDSCEAETFEDAAVPADAYHQIRLRLAPNLPELPGESVLEENSCGTAGLNCMVTSDGSVRPLVLDSKASQIQILPEQIADGFFRILPDTSIGLKIEFNPQSSMFMPSEEGMRLVPSFTATALPPCDTAASTNR